MARANALEDNVSLYYTQNGRRNTIKYVDSLVAGNQWHMLRAEFSGRHFRVQLDGTIDIEVDDGHIDGYRADGVWTKADGSLWRKPRDIHMGDEALAALARRTL